MIGLHLSRWDKPPRQYRAQYKRQLREVRASPGPFKVIKKPSYDAGEHPRSYIDAECAFAATNLARLQPTNVLDIGSYRHFLLGLMAHYQVTSLDVRERHPATPHETVVTGDAKSLRLVGESFDAVVSLCTLEHLGLGRYGDAYDLNADVAAFEEMKRVLRVGGSLIFSTTVTRGTPVMAFNTFRVYSLDMIHDLCRGLTPTEEGFYSMERDQRCSVDDVRASQDAWDVYLGCWTKM